MIVCDKVFILNEQFEWKSLSIPWSSKKDQISRYYTKRLQESLPTTKGSFLNDFKWSFTPSENTLS